MNDYPCDDCGYEGPHTTIESKPGSVILECGSCYHEFEVVRDS
jgi:predicted RNA-binding Zn-ribbon protein involved in translation (DUF1610 family)